MPDRPDNTVNVGIRPIFPWMVDWMDALPVDALLMKPYDDRWLNELSGKKPDDHDLGVKTGLVVSHGICFAAKVKK